VPWSIAKLFYPSENIFQKYDSPLKESHWIYDTGIVDANRDGLLDIFTSNHNWRQQLLLADDQGGYRDALSQWKLDHSREFPGIEISTIPPVFDKPGLYIYWYNRHLYIRTHHLKDNRSASMVIHALTELQLISNNGFRISEKEYKVLYSPDITSSTMRLSSNDDAVIKLFPRSRGVPINIILDDNIPLTEVYLGNQRVSPKSPEFSLPLQDRHALAWSDFNNDGQPDIFITRGAIGGTLRIYPESFARKVNEELFISNDGDASENPQFINIISETSIVKNGCSARHASWIDYNMDGLLDIFINCEDVGNVEGKYPNKLYQQVEKHQFVEVAEQAGLQILENNIIDYEWFDADNDGDMDLFTHQDNGFYLYHNSQGQYESKFIGRSRFARVDNPKLKGASGAYWIFDGKLSVADYDRDGDLDVFAASKKGNTLLINENGAYIILDPSIVGLPENSVSASWVDYNNDGLTDLHTIPAGIYRQVENHTFDSTNLLVLPSKLYMAGIINWYDIDNNGTRDVLIALNENQNIHRWWESSTKDTFLWKFLTYLNTDTENHWLQLKLVGTPGNLEAIGARVTLSTKDGQQVQEVGINDGAFYSQGHYRLYFGLGQHNKVDLITIRWPDGVTQELRDVSSDSLLIIERDKQQS
jgi:hypothetical protein